MARLIGGIAVGFVLWAVVWLFGKTVIVFAAPDAVQDDGAISSPIALVIALALSVFASIAAGFACGLISREKTITSGVMLGVILFAAGATVQVRNWDESPLWFHIPFLLLLLPAAIAGSGLALRPNANARAKKNPTHAT